MKFLSNKYLNILLIAVFGSFLSYDFYESPTTIISWVKCALFLVLFIYIPGRAIVEKAIVYKGLQFITALGIGFILNSALFVLAQYLEFMPILIVPIVILDGYWIFKKWPNRKSLKDSWSDMKIFYQTNIATINSVLFLMILISPYLFINFPVSDIGETRMVDDQVNNLFWQISRIEMFKSQFPVPDWSLYELKDIPYKYHYFMYLWLAEASNVFNIDSWFLYIRFLQYFLVGTVFISVLKIAKLITNDDKKAMMGAYMGTLGAGATFGLGFASLVRYGVDIKYLYAVGHTNFLDWTLLSPTMTFSVFIFLVLLGLLHEWIKNESKLIYVLYLITVFALLISKGSSGMIYIATLSVYSLIYFDKKFIAKITIPSIVVFAIGYWLIFMNYSAEAVLGQDLGFYSFKIISWLKDSVKGIEMVVLLGGFLGGTIGIRALTLLNKNENKIAKLMKVGFVMGTIFFIVSPLKFMNTFWQVPFLATAGILVAEYVMNLKRNLLRKILFVIMGLEIAFGALVLLNGGANGFTVRGISEEKYIEGNQYEAYKYIDENTPEDSVIWTMTRGEERVYFFNCMAVCKRQNLLEGWGFSRYIGDWKYFTEEQKENHFVQKILDDESVLLTSKSLDEINSTLDKYEDVDYIVYPLDESTNEDIFDQAEGLEKLFENEKYVIYKH